MITPAISVLSAVEGLQVVSPSLESLVLPIALVILTGLFAIQRFEPVWSAEHIAEIQIDVPETLGVENRAQFHDATGAFRDLLVTHLLQALGFVTMEPPAAFSADALATEKQRVFGALHPLDPGKVVRGQYDGYRDLPRRAGRFGHRDAGGARGADRQLALGPRRDGHRFRDSEAQITRFELFDQIWVGPALKNKVTEAQIDRRTKRRKMDPITIRPGSRSTTSPSVRRVNDLTARKAVYTGSIPVSAC